MKRTKVIACRESMSGDGRLWVIVTLKLWDGRVIEVCREIDY